MMTLMDVHGKYKKLIKDCLLRYTVDTHEKHINDIIKNCHKWLSEIKQLKEEQ